MVKRKAYIPERGDVIWISLNPQTGHEQSGRRPALVLSPSSYNSKVSLSIVCPITNKIKGYPFEVKIEIKDKIKGVILADQIKSLDWEKRNAKFIGRVTEKTSKRVIENILLLIN